MEKRYDVAALGELLIDFTRSGVSPQGNPLWEANPGSAPCNVLAMLTRLGHTTAFLGKVGQDGFGDQLETALREVGIDTRALRRDGEVPTTLAVVHKKPNGDRDFSFYRKPGADLMLYIDELDTALLADCRIFHFGTLSLTAEPCRATTRKALALAGQAGALRSFDPNLREPLWDSLDDAREQVLFGLAHCDILKISDNEIQWLTGETDFDRAVRWIQSRFTIPLILLTLGPDGSRAWCGGVTATHPGFKLSNTVETTGAGDTFMGCALHYVLANGWHPYTEEELSGLLRFANAAAAIITTRPGALRVMPKAQEIKALLELTKR